MDPPRPFKVLDVFGRKSKSKAPNAFKFGTKRVTMKVNNWWKFGVDISNHFWEIKNLTFFHSNSFPLAYKNSFRKLFFYLMGNELKRQNGWVWISQRWFEILIPNFHQLYLIGTRFVPNMKVLGAQNLDFPPKTSKTSNGHGRLSFWATPSKFWENPSYHEL